MAEIIRLRNNPHAEVQELIPWFINRTLTAQEIERIEAHLAECPECRAELEQERQLAAAVGSNDAADVDPEWERMEANLEAPIMPGLRQAVPLWQMRVPLGWAIASPLAAAAAIALVLFNLPSTPTGGSQYRALGNPGFAQTANLVVQFQSSSNINDLQRALQMADARLVDGPTQTGAYLLHVDPAKRPLALKLLRDNEAISLAQPIDAPARE